MELCQRLRLTQIVRRGKELIRTYPEIAQRFRDGESYSKIARYLEHKGLIDNNLEKVIGYAIRGHPGGLGIKEYDGLIPEEERTKIVNIHRLNSGHVLQEEKRGLFGISEEERKRNSRNGGKVGGKISKKNKRGIFAQTPKELKIVSMKGIISRGQTPWEVSYSEETGISEEDYAFELSQFPEYIFQSGPNKGRVMCKKIAEEINRLYGNNRTPNAVNIKLKKKKHQ